MTDSDPNDQESPGTTTRREYLGAAAAFSTLPHVDVSSESNSDTDQSTDPDIWPPYLHGYISDCLVHTAHNELTMKGGDPEKARFLLRHAIALIDAKLLEADDPFSVPHNPEWEIEHREV